MTPTSANSGRNTRDFSALKQKATETFFLPQYNYSRFPSGSGSTTPNTTAAKDKVSTPLAEPAIQEEPEDPQESAIDLLGETQTPPLTRRSTRSSTGGGTFKRTMSSLFRRSTSQVNSASSTPPQQPAPTSNPTSQPVLRVSSHVDGKNGAVSTNGNDNGSTPASRNTSRFSFSRSAVTTRSNTPPSPGSPLQQTPSVPTVQISNGILPEPTDFDNKKKNRSATGLSFRGKTINFLAPNTPRNGRPTVRDRRASSFSYDSDRGDVKGRNPKSNHGDQPLPPERLPWAMPPDAGTGAKARRMSLSLPDDFTVDVAELTKEFEYQSKFLGRHGKHLGKGAASKVTLMARKGCPDELYAVKEFRGKSHRESKDDYDKKIKSEYSIAKSLHHPNIVETIRLCTDHSRWNHVMEYCGEGDLFSLVSKGWLKDEQKKKDRLCLFKQLVQGVNYLHEHGIAHRDIKLENLLITKDSKLKITDFGVSEVFCGTHPGLRESGGQCGQNMDHDVRLCAPGICGSEPYIAPEVLAKKAKYDPRPLDVWSTAIVMIYLIFGGAIWARAAPGNEHYDSLVRGWEKWHEKHPEPDAVIADDDYPHQKAFDMMVSPPALRRLLLQMLHPDPAKRISINEVINNRWMKNVECCQPESYDDPSQVIDATKSKSTWNGHKKIFCHSHLPPKSQGASLGKMPGQPGY